MHAHSVQVISLAFKFTSLTSNDEQNVSLVNVDSRRQVSKLVGVSKKSYSVLLAVWIDGDHSGGYLVILHLMNPVVVKWCRVPVWKIKINIWLLSICLIAELKQQSVLRIGFLNKNQAFIWYPKRNTVLEDTGLSQKESLLALGVPNLPFVVAGFERFQSRRTTSKALEG